MSVLSAILSIFFPLCGTHGATGITPPGVVDFSKLYLQGHSEYLAAPPAYFKTPDQEIPLFHVSPAVLYADILATGQAQPRSFVLDTEPQALQAAYVVRSPNGNFPDVIEIAIIPEPNNESGLIFYSHSIYGESDYGKNKQHAQDWLEMLNTKVSP
jgi:hypothetical protein